MVLAQADNGKKTSAAARFRHRRMALFLEILKPGPEIRLLDLGGTSAYWTRFKIPCHVTILNFSHSSEVLPELDYRIGDARDLSQFNSQSFDIVFSNSVIEHVGGIDDQKAMAREARRVGKRYFIQTPNRLFPLEPHFLFPCMQFLPRPLRRIVARYWPLGWYKPNSSDAMAAAAGIRLLTASEMHALFPDAWILGERCAGLNKSLIAVKANRVPIVEGFSVLYAPVRTP